MTYKKITSDIRMLTKPNPGELRFVDAISSAQNEVKDLARYANQYTDSIASELDRAAASIGKAHKMMKAYFDKRTKEREEIQERKKRERAEARKNRGSR